MPLWTGLGSLFMPLGIAFLIFVSRNPEISQNLGLISAKADLVAFAATDWHAYTEMFGQLVGSRGPHPVRVHHQLGLRREFADGTLKDMLAVPVPRSEHTCWRSMP